MRNHISYRSIYTYIYLFGKFIIEISKNRLGAVAVVDVENNLLGVITDGDIRRMLENNVDIATALAQNKSLSLPKVSNSKNKTSKTGSESKMQMPNNANTPNQSLAIQNYNTSENQSKSASSKKSVLGNSKQNNTKGISEERIVFGKENKFNSTAKQQLSNSIFDEKLTSKKSSSIISRLSKSPLSSIKEYSDLSVFTILLEINS